MSGSRFIRYASHVGKLRYGLAILAWLVCSAPLPGQGGLSTLRGTVTDPSGAVVPQAKVTVEEVGTGITARSVTTDAQGNYEVPALKEATYRLRVEAKGFETSVISDIHLAGNEAKRVDVALRVGATASQVVVSAAATVIETEGAKIGSEFSGDQYHLAPLPANSYSSPLPVIATMPQIQTDAGNEFGITMAGQGGTEIHMAMDGVKEENLNTQTVNMEDVEEVKVNAVNNSAEYARVGVFDTITKSGSNQYHAEASYYNRNSALGARGFFETEKPIVIYNTFNLSGSGPIRKNRTFFYGLWNGERVHEQSFFTDNVPTEKMRGGDFSDLLNASPAIQIFNPYTGQPFQGNVIPPGMLNSLALKVQDIYIPHPNLGPPGNLINNFGWLFPYPEDQYRADVLVARIDHKISDKHLIYGRYSGYWPRYILNDGNFPNLDWTKLRQSHSWAIVDTYTFTPSLVNSFTFGGNRDRSVYGVKLNGYQPPTGDKAVSAIGLQGVNPSNLAAQGLPDMYFNDIAGPGIEVPPGGINGKAAELGENWNVAEALTWAKGRHVMKFGEELRTFMFYTTDLPNGTYGDFSFNGSMTGYDYADFLLGLPFSSTRLNPLVGRTQHGKEMGLFAMDTFKVTHKLTLDYGLRWDYFGAFRYDDGLQDNYNPVLDAVAVPEAALGKISPLYPSNIKVVTGQVVPNPSLRNFVPRLGAAYLITEKTVLRGGYGLFTSRGLGVYSLLDSGPFSLSENYTNTIQNGQALFAFPNPFPANIGLAEVPSQAVIGYPLDMRDGKIHQFNFTVEHQLQDIGLRASYVGSRTRGLNGFYEVNKPMPSTIPFDNSRLPHPEFRSIQLLRRDLAANYDSFTLEGHRRIGHLSFDAFWTWANNLDNYEILASGYGTLYGPSYGNFGDENPYAPLLWNHDHVTPHHRVVINVQWDVPVGRGRRFLSNAPGVLDKVVGGWSAYYVGFFQTGQWFTPFFSTTDPSNTNSFGGLPDRIANGNLPPGQRTVNNWFNAAAFKIPGCPDSDPACANPANIGRFGNSGINVLEGPGLMSHNLTVRKRFEITERLHFDFMALCSNLFNHPNFSPPSSTIDAPGAGIITGQHDRYFSGEKSGPRVIELRGRLEF
ncbi:MAG TPA: TonB-dependent receptor [Terriglobia bacterium]|nr:TonB-dependent receptor [Terriglobia bacterium]